MPGIALIKPILILLVLGLFSAYMVYVRNRLLDRLFGLLLFLGAVLLILFPDVSTRIAALLGVGRGVDLILYLLVCLGGYALVALYARVQETSAQVTELARHLAIHTARRAAKSDRADA
jgi:hypothetical protein